MVRVVLIAAVARNGVIGDRGELPWYIPADFRRFKERTMGKPVVMGRKTFEAIAKRLGGPLPGRYNIVVSQSRTIEFCGAIPHEVVLTPQKALARAAAAARRLEVPEAMVIGGASVYRVLLPHADELDLTVIERDYPGDAVFPRVDPKTWREFWREDHTPNSDVPFQFVRYARICEP
jgi:dihydrofolate reductase